MNRKLAGIIIGILVIAGAAGGIYYGVLAPEVFKTARAGKNNIQEIVSGSGNLKSNRIKTEYTGDTIEVQKMMVKEGDKVKEGDILLKYKKVKMNNAGKPVTGEEELELTAEFEGVITGLYTENGATVPSAGKLLQISDDRDMYAAIKISQNNIENISEGQHAVVTMNDYEYEGEVTRINYQAQEDSGKPKVTVEVKVDNVDDKILLGEEVDIDIYTKFRENVVSVPIESVYSDADNDFVYVISNGMVSRELISTGISSGEWTEVKEGLAVDDVVITSEVSDSDRGKRAVSQ